MVNIHRAGPGAFERLVSADLGPYLSNADSKVQFGTDNGEDTARQPYCIERDSNMVLWERSTGRNVPNSKWGYKSGLIFSRVSGLLLVLRSHTICTCGVCWSRSDSYHTIKSQSIVLSVGMRRNQARFPPFGITMGGGFYEIPHTLDCGFRLRGGAYCDVPPLLYYRSIDYVATAVCSTACTSLGIKLLCCLYYRRLWSLLDPVIGRSKSTTEAAQR